MLKWTTNRFWRCNFIKIHRTLRCTPVMAAGVTDRLKNASGDLVLSASLIQNKPVILQEGKRIEGGYVVRGREVAFELRKYDVAKPLVIDPVLVYSTYLACPPVLRDLAT